MTTFPLDDLLAFARRLNYEAGHTHQVIKLALRLFEDLQPLHGLDAEARFFLEAGSLLHDIGWIEGKKAHHKTALKYILEASELQLSDRERLIIGSVARYHRRALPSLEHDHYRALSESDRTLVDWLAGILRVADGLDRSHQSVVTSLQTEIGEATLRLLCRVRGNAEPEREFALEKGTLLEQVSGRQLIIELQPQ